MTALPAPYFLGRRLIRHFSAVEPEAKTAKTTIPARRGHGEPAVPNAIGRRSRRPRGLYQAMANPFTRLILNI